jgi:hypothetical protein
MFKLHLIPLLTLTIASFGQNTLNNDSLQNAISENLAKSRRSMDSLVHPIKYAKTLEGFLTATFPVNSTKDGRWVYYKDNGNIQKIEKRTIGKILPEYNIYKVNLTNYLGWHVNQGTCLIFLDSVHSRMTYAEPLWYGGVSEPLIKLFIGKTLNQKDTLLSFLTELNELMQIGSSYKFRVTAYSDTLIKLDLGYFKGDSYTTGGSGITSTVNYNEDGVWRKILIEIKDFAIKRYTAINPQIGSKEIIE